MGVAGTPPAPYRPDHSSAPRTPTPGASSSPASLERPTSPGPTASRRVIVDRAGTLRTGLPPGDKNLLTVLVGPPPTGACWSGWLGGRCATRATTPCAGLRGPASRSWWPRSGTISPWWPPRWWPRASGVRVQVRQGRRAAALGEAVDAGAARTGPPRRGRARRRVLPRCGRRPRGRRPPGTTGRHRGHHPVHHDPSEGNDEPGQRHLRQTRRGSPATVPRRGRGRPAAGLPGRPGGRHGTVLRTSTGQTARGAGRRGSSSGCAPPTCSAQAGQVHARPVRRLRSRLPEPPAEPTASTSTTATSTTVSARRDEAMFAGRAESYRSRAGVVQPHATPRTWLDVGAGHGHFCQHARDSGPTRPSTGWTCGDGRPSGRATGLDRRTATVACSPTSPPDMAGRYDVVSMFHYLEHSSEPPAELAAARTALRPGGHLLIEVPDPESLARPAARSLVAAVAPAAAPVLPPRGGSAEGTGGARLHRGPRTASRAVRHRRPDGRGAAGGDAVLPPDNAPWLAQPPGRARWLLRCAGLVAAIPGLVVATTLDRLLLKPTGRAGERFPMPTVW